MKASGDKEEQNKFFTKIKFRGYDKLYNERNITEEQLTAAARYY